MKALLAHNCIWTIIWNKRWHSRDANQRYWRSETGGQTKWKTATIGDIYPPYRHSSPILPQPGTPSSLRCRSAIQKKKRKEKRNTYLSRNTFDENHQQPFSVTIFFLLLSLFSELMRSPLLRWSSRNCRSLPPTPLPSYHQPLHPPLPAVGMVAERKKRFEV